MQVCTSTGLVLATMMRALLSVVVASIEVEVTAACHPLATVSNVGVVTTDTGKKHLHFDLTTALRCMTALAVQSSDMRPADLIELFELQLKPRVSTLMTQGHSAATAFESLACNASWIRGETDIRAAITPSGGGPGPSRPAPTTPTTVKGPKTVRVSEDPGDRSELLKEVKALRAENKLNQKLLADQRTKNERLVSRTEFDRRRDRDFPRRDRDADRSPNWRRDTTSNRDTRRG